MNVRFDEALNRAVQFARDHRSDLGDEVVIVRDLLGRIRIAISSEPATIDALAEQLNSLLGGFSPGVAQIFLTRGELLAPDGIFGAPELRTLEAGIKLLERWVTSTDWLRAPLPRASTASERVTFFGIKGGVGRSTALVALARHLAERGQRVLVVDLDLESPGVTASLLPSAVRPSFGIVDWFVEQDVGQADDALLRDLVATSPLAGGTPGEIRVVPAGGSVGVDTYVSKLARLYASSPGTGDFATRLARLIDALEALEHPDWVLLDSRAGIHDLAAIAVTRLDATSLLFAVDSAQTWLAYRYLFATWQKDPAFVGYFRDRLRIVAAQVPETGRDAYLARLRDHASDLFSDYLYDEVDPKDAKHVEAFNFDVSDPEAPHSPVPVYWRRELQDWDPTLEPATVSPDQALEAFGALFQFVDEVLVRSVIVS